MKTSSALKGILHYLWDKNTIQLKVILITSLIFLILSKVCNAYAPFFFKLIIEKLEGPIYSIPLFLIILYSGLKILAQIFNEIKESTFVYIEQNAVKHSGTEIFHHLHALSLSFHLERKTGEITKNIERGVKAVETILRFSTFILIPTLCEIIIVCLLLLYLYSIAYTIIIFTTLIIYGAYTIVITEWRTSYIRAMKAADSQASARAVDSLINYETVKYFNSEQYEENNYAKLLKKYKQAAIINRFHLSFLNIGQAIIIALGLTAINSLACKDLMLHALNLSDFFLVNAYLLQLYQPLSNLGFSYREIKLALIDVESMLTLLYEKEQVVLTKDTAPLHLTEGLISFEDVSFSYYPERPIIKGISFKISPGKTLAIVGGSGAGKSTIAKLLFRFYDVNSGVIKIDNQNINQVTLSSLRKCIGVVPQDTVLFNESIFYNIAYAKHGMATLQEVQRVATLAQVNDFILSLPKQYDTIVGERGLKLSGGEKQRIAIARVLLKEAKILIFDESTSSLDTRTEKEIQKNIYKISKGHSTLIIAHRLSTVVAADEILVLEEGKIVERGTHSMLLKQEGVYKKMWNYQQEKTEKH